MHISSNLPEAHGMESRHKQFTSTEKYYWSCIWNSFPVFKQMRIGVTDWRVLQKCLPQELTLQWGVAAEAPAPSSSAQSCGTGAHPKLQVRDFWRPLKGTNLYMQLEHSPVRSHPPNKSFSTPSKQICFSVGAAGSFCIPNLPREQICWSDLSTRQPSLLQQGCQDIPAINRAIHPILTGKLEHRSHAFSV